MRELNLARYAAERFLQRNLQIVTQIFSARRSVAPHRLLRTAFTEEHIEDVAEATGAEALAEPHVAEAVARARAVSNRAVAIVLRAFLRVRQHFVGLIDLFEAMLRVGFIDRYVGMMLARELAVSAPHLVGIRCPADAKHFVEVARHRAT